MSSVDPSRRSGGYPASSLRSARRVRSSALPLFAAASALAAALALVTVAGCGGVDAPLGLDEPIRVRDATFVAGPLPGLPPADGAPPAGPAVTVIDSVTSAVVLGDAGFSLSGRTSTDAVALALAFEGQGTGYWVEPVGPPDPTAGNEYTWDVDANIGWDVTLGNGAIDLVAIGADGAAGRQSRLPVCVRPDVPDNFNSCDPTLAPPDTVLSLSWDAPADLDLIVLTPDGKRVGPGHPSTVADDPVTAADLAAPHVGVLDRDSNAGCAIDGIDREDLVWKTSPEPGTYLVYADLADACDVPTVWFSATLYRAQQADDGTWSLVLAQRQEGALTRVAADGGAGPGLFLMQLAL